MQSKVGEVRKFPHIINGNAFSLVEISIFAHPKQISVVSKSDKKKQKTKKASAHFHTFPLPF